MATTPQRYQLKRVVSEQEKWVPAQKVKAILADTECRVGPVTLATPIKLPLHLFHEIIDEHRAGKKSRI